ncbi:hypothetical protein LTR95_011180 [Oleoguttula sp. CCFEE 5521]
MPRLTTLKVELYQVMYWDAGYNDFGHGAPEWITGFAKWLAVMPSLQYLCLIELQTLVASLRPIQLQTLILDRFYVSLSALTHLPSTQTASLQRLSLTRCTPEHGDKGSWRSLFSWAAANLELTDFIVFGCEGEWVEEGEGNNIEVERHRDRLALIDAVSWWRAGAEAVEQALRLAPEAAFRVATVQTAIVDFAVGSCAGWDGR